MTEKGHVHHRLDGTVLSVVSVCLLIWLTIRALNQPLSYDESWHIYFGAVTPYWKAALELGRDMHPPLHSLVLRPLVAFSTDPIWPRMLSIVAAAVQPFLWFGILRKLGVGRALSLAGTVTLCASHLSSDLSFVIRGYALGATCGMAAAYYLIDVAPGGTPKRRNLAIGLVFLGLAFGCEYPAAIALTMLAAGLAVSGMIHPEFGRTIRHNLQHYTQKPERVFAVGSIILVLAFYCVSFGTRELLNGEAWLPQDGQSTIDFVLNGLVMNLYYFSPVDLRDVGFGPALAAIAWLVTAGIAWSLARRHDAHASRSAAVLFALLLTTTTIAVLGLLRKYPWGGAPRHQYLVGLLMHCSFIATVHQLTHRVSNWRPWIAIAIVVGAAFTTTSSHRHFTTGELLEATLWAEETATVFPEGGDTPVCVTNCSFHGIYGVHRESIDIQFERPIGHWDEYSAGQPRRPMLRARYRWTISPVPDLEFLCELLDNCRRLEIDRVRVFAMRFDGSTIEERQALEADAIAACESVGFAMHERKVWAEGETYLLTVED